jgi:fatty acid desaturase
MNVAAEPQTIDRETLRLWSQRSDAPGVIHLAGHCGALLLTGALIWLARGTFWIWPAMWAHGVVLIFLFTPLHETIHRTAFKTRALNEAVAFVIGVLILLPREYFRAFHFAHHRFTQDPEKDPELAAPKPANLRQWLWQVSGMPYWIAQTRGTIAHAFGRAPESFYKDDRQRRAVILEARIVLALYVLVLIASIAAGSTSALVYWAVPALLGQPALRLYLMAEHGLCPLTPDMLENTRTTYANALVRALAWNMPYHAEHHAYPAVPFHRLAEVNRAIASRLKVTAPGYIAVQRQILRSLRR